MCWPTRIAAVLLVLLAVPELTLAQKQAPDAKKPGSMYGEKVLSVDEGTLLNPLRRFDDQPWFEIANLRPGRNLRDALELDFAYEGEIKGPIHIVVLTNGKRHRFPVAQTTLSKHQGSITCSFDAIEDKSPLGADLEAYVEFTDAEQRYVGSGSRSRTSFSSQSDSNYEQVDPLFFKVSKSATRGQVEALTFARELRPTELRIYETRKKKLGPPPPPPDGTTLAQATTPIVPGTPVLAAFEGDWLKAEVLAAGTDGRLVVHWPKFGHPGNRSYERKLVAVSDDVLAKLKLDPKSFTPSVELPAGSLQPPPPDYVVLPDKLKLLPGTPVKVTWGSSPWDYTIVRDGPDQVAMLSDRQPVREENYQRRQIMIHKDVVQQLAEPDTEKKFAARLKEVQAANPFNRVPRSTPTVRFPPSPYPITIALPDDYVRVTKDTPLEVGTRCMACWASRWNVVTVRALQGNGEVDIHWEGWSTIEPLTRDSLIIAKGTLADLEAKKKTAAAKKPDGKTPADYKPAESTEKFKISLDATGSKRIPVFKIIMEITGFDLPSAKEVADNAPIDLKSGLSKTDAEKWKQKLEDAGAKASIEAVKPKAKDKDEE